MEVDSEVKAFSGDPTSDDSKMDEGECDVSVSETDAKNKSEIQEGGVSLKKGDMVNSTLNGASSKTNGHIGDADSTDKDSQKENHEDPPHEESGSGDSNGTTEDHKTSENTLQNGSARASSKKRRRSSALHTSVSDSPDVTHRSSGRSRKPKLDTEDSLPTDTVLAKSPRRGRKSVDFTPSPEPMKETSGSSEDSITEQNGSSDLATEKASVEVAGESEAEAAADGLATKYEPGDLIWGRLTGFPFWPCIVIYDPVEPIFYKQDGRGRLTYHVLFYGDNGRRSWVNSTMILRFLGLENFDMQAAAVTKEMKKKDPKLCLGFVIKPYLKKKWLNAVNEAEAVMPISRDERLDAFLSSMPQKKGRKSKVFEDEQENDETNEDALATEVNTEDESSESPTAGKKKKVAPKVESPSPEKKKRGRPRKIQINSDEMEIETPEPVAKSTPGPKRGRKRKLQTEVETNQSSKDDPAWKVGTKKKRKKRKNKKAQEDKAFTIFCEKHLDRVHDDNPDLSEVEAQKYLSLLWDQKDEEEKIDFIRLVATDDKSGEESESESEDEDEDDDNEDDNEVEQDETGVEDEVAAVESASSGKELEEENPVLSILQKKINLFKGYKAERVCQGCEKPGKTVKCRGPCAGVFHVECARGADNSVGQFSLIEDAEDKPKKRGRKKKEVAVENPEVKEVPKKKVSSRQKNIYADEETDSDLDYADGEVMPNVCDEESIMRMILGNATELPEVSMVDQTQSEEEEDEDDSEDQTELSDGPISSVISNIGDFRCGDCAVSRTPLCYACGQASVPSGEDSVRVRCSAAHCGKHYHIECLKVLWPQASYSTNKGTVHNFTCPQHKCHTCVSDNPRDNKGKFVHEKLVRCVRCPTSYHYGNYCVPAGSKILTASQMICPRHPSDEPPKKGSHHINASWCFICSIGGSLICCDLCPSSFHIDCLKIKPPTGGYICEDCETGRYPLYNEVLWVKLGNYRWWPAVSLFPSEIPDNVVALPHRLGEFAVRFLGTNDHYWIDRGRCFMYHDGDCPQKKSTNKSNMEQLYQKGVLQANELHKAHKEMRMKIQSQIKMAPPVKPPQYVKIKTNKAVGNVRIVEVDTSTISPCECNPKSEHPCSPDSECLNRILMVECDPNTCPAGEKCENQCFEKRIYPSLAPCYTDGRGWGLKVLEDIPKGTFVIEYVGEVIDDDEYQKRLLKKHEEKDENYYFLTIDSTRIIDAGPKGNVSRFMNHSCQPNCETQKWTVMGDTRVGLFSLCDIPADTELTFNYNLESKGNEKKPCMCGAAICSGFIGAKKNKVAVTDSKEPSSTGKKKRRKPRVRNLIEDICLLCDGGKELGTLILCINKECATKYHLSCLGLVSHPLGKWLCPRHHCNVCQKRTQQFCSYCTESYCSAHVTEKNLFSDPLHGDICEAHQKNPLSKEHQKTKRDEQRKQLEEEKRKIDEEKRKQYEEERAKRRSRRAQISNEEEAAEAKGSDVDDTLSESSAIGDSKTVLTDEKLNKNDALSEKEKPRTKVESRPSSAKKTPKAKAASEIKEASPAPSRRGRKKKIVPVEEDKNLHLNEDIEKDEIKKELPQSIEDDLKEIKMDLKPNLIEESQISSSHCNDSMKDDIPDADPSLDKFILTPVPMDDSPESFTTKKRKKSVSPKSDQALPNEASPSSVTKRRRKPPVHNMDYVNSQSLNLKRPYFDSSPIKSSSVKKVNPKKSKETNFDKVGLMDELEDIATGFASDDSQESPKIQFKKVPVKGKRLSLGHVRSHTADSTTGDSPDAVGKDKNSPRMSPKKLKSPVTPNPLLSPGSPGNLSASKIFAMQRAKGLKVMPPNRRLSLAREQNAESRLGSETEERVERSAKGLKVMKGRRFSAESSVEGKKTENLHGGVPQNGVLKKIRPVLSKVQDNGVSVEDDVEDKSLENGVLASPKQPQPHSMLSPPSKKLRVASPKKSPIGVCSLWNQDILNIMK